MIYSYHIVNTKKSLFYYYSVLCRKVSSKQWQNKCLKYSQCWQNECLKYSQCWPQLHQFKFERDTIQPTHINIWHSHWSLSMFYEYDRNIYRELVFIVMYMKKMAIPPTPVLQDVLQNHSLWMRMLTWPRVFTAEYQHILFLPTGIHYI